MYEQNTQENESNHDQQQQLTEELISIRKKLIAPNNILPASMIRSQLAQHILSIRTSREFQSGCQLLLDDVGYQSDVETTPLVKALKSKKLLSKEGKNRSKSELPEFKKKQQFKLNESDRLQNPFERNEDILQFLNKNIKNLFNFPQKIVFISQSALLCNIKSNKYKNSGESHPEDRKGQEINYLKGNRHFGSTAYAYDQSHKQEEMKILKKAINQDEYLEFQDQFESSNLYLAMKCDYQLMNSFKKEGENYQHLYFLTVRLDYNTKSYGQWFYFKVKRKENHFTFSRNGSRSFKFMIINMTKNSSLFGKGLKISVCRKGIWGKEGSNIRYYRNSLRREDIFSDNNDQSPLASLKSPQNFYTLEFSLDLSEGQELYISYNEPYTYSRVGKLLDKITAKYEENQHNIIDLKRNIICSTYLSNNIQVLTFSAKKSVAQPLHISIQEKKVIFIMGRTHPIETAGSHVIEGILNEIYDLFIQNPKEQHRSHIIYRLLQEYIIKIIPMVNPDGVILGNSRCNLAGFDLNRCWKTPKFQKSKEIFYIKRHIFQYQQRIKMFIDLHAHSKKKNVFAYGCHDTANPFATREFPFLLSKLSQNDFLFNECRFTKLNELKLQVNQKKSTKDGTARVFLYDSLRIPNIFTIENSYCSAKNSPFHYDTFSYGKIGADILKAISLYFSPCFKQNNELMLQKNEKEKELERKRLSSQNHIKISLHSAYKSDIELKVTINAERQQVNTKLINSSVDEDLTRYRNPNQLREKFLFELHQKQENIKIGLLKDNELSESEEQERIYETHQKKKEKNSSQAGFTKKAKGQSKTDRLINYLHKNTAKPSPQKSSINKKSVLNVSHISSTHSESNLAKISKITKSRFRTLAKQEEMVMIPDDVCHDNYIKERRKLLSRRQRIPTQFQISKKEKNDNCLSIVEIGLGNEIQPGQMEQKVVIIDRFQTKERLKTFHGFRQQRTIHTERSQTKNIQAPRNFQLKDDEIKEYLRRIMKPKQLIQKKQRNDRLFRLHEKNERIQQKIKQSYMQFNDMRLSKLVILQNSKKVQFDSSRQLP